MSIASRNDEKRYVLVVEDEPVLRTSMVRGLSKLPGVEARGAGSVREARTALGEAAPDVVISDLDLPDGSGLEVAAELDRLGLRVPLVFASAYILQYRGLLPQRPGVDILEKPVSLDQLRRLVAERLEGGEAGAGPSPFGVADYVQLAGMGRRSVVIEVRGAGAVRGSIVIRSGELWSAADERGEGMDAFRRLAFLRDASVTCAALGPQLDTKRTLSGSCEEALLETARLLDEQSTDGGGDLDSAWDEAAVGMTLASIAPGALPSRTPPAPPVIPKAPPLPREKSFEELYEEGVDALLTKDFPAALTAFAAAGKLRDDPRVRANLHRLAQMGYTT